MTTLLKMENPKIDYARVYNSLHFADVIPVNFPTNYYILTLPQRDFVNSIINGVCDFYEPMINQHNSDLEDQEKDIDDEYYRR